MASAISQNDLLFHFKTSILTFEIIIITTILVDLKSEGRNSPNYLTLVIQAYNGVLNLIPLF